MSVRNLDVLNKLPSYITPFGLGKNIYSDTWLQENKGDTINEYNKFFGEATGMYWIWKNLIKNFNENDWIGFCQYRRLWLNDLFEEKQKYNFSSVYSNLLKEDNLIFDKAESILLQPTVFYKDTLFQQFDKIYGENILYDCLNLIENEKEKNNFENYLKNNSISICNMFVTKPKYFVSYCKSMFNWIFKCYDFCKGKNLLNGHNTRLPIFLVERYTSFWFHNHTNVKYLSFARLGNFFLSNKINKFINPLKLPFTFRNYPTIHKF